MDINAGQSFVWDAVDGAESYDVELLNDTLGVSFATFSDIAETHITAVELFEGHGHGNYFAKVRGVDFVGPGAWSAPLGLTFVALPAPTNLRVE